MPTTSFPTDENSRSADLPDPAHQRIQDQQRWMPLATQLLHLPRGGASFGPAAATYEIEPPRLDPSSMDDQPWRKQADVINIWKRFHPDLSGCGEFACA